MPTDTRATPGSAAVALDGHHAVALDDLLRTEQVAIGDLAAQATAVIRQINHLTHPATAELTNPCDAADVIAALAAMTWMLPQLLGQLAHWLQHEHRAGRLRVDDLAPLPNSDQTMQALTRSLQHASQALRHAAEELDTAHQHAAHLATTEADTPARARGQNSCRSVGPNHLTKRSQLSCQPIQLLGGPDLHTDSYRFAHILAAQGPPKPRVTSTFMATANPRTRACLP